MYSLKVAIMCESILLQESLKIFLNRYITSYKNADFVIADKHIDTVKPIFIISNTKHSNLNIPFTNTKLQIELENFYNSHNITKNPNTLETQIENLIKDYTQQLLTIVKNYS